MRLREKRVEKKYTQQEMAERVGITQVAYSNYELGKRYPKPEMLKTLATVLGCTVDELLTEPEVYDADDRTS